MVKEKPNSSDFSIDASHELATFIWDEGQGPTLQHSSLLCLRADPHCATYPKPFEICVSTNNKSKITMRLSSFKWSHRQHRLNNIRQ